MRNTFIRVLVKDEYSVLGQEAQMVLEELLRQEGAYVEVQEVEPNKVNEKIHMIHVIQEVIVPTVYREEEIPKAVSLEDTVSAHLQKVLDIVYPNQKPDVFFSKRLLPRVSFTSLFSK